MSLPQIEVHPDLADVLKAYAKAVIRIQPENLLDFSAKYVAGTLLLSACMLKPRLPCNLPAAASKPILYTFYFNCICRYFADLASKRPAQPSQGSGTTATAAAAGVVS